MNHLRGGPVATAPGSDTLRFHAISLNEMTEPNLKQSIERALTAEIKLYYDVVEPSSQPAPLLIALHGYGASKWHALREAKLTAPDGFALAALQGPHQHLREPKQTGGPLRYGFGWLSNYRPEESVAIHHQALRDMIQSLVDEGVADRESDLSARLFSVVRAELSVCIYASEATQRRHWDSRWHSRRLGNQRCLPANNCVCLSFGGRARRILSAVAGRELRGGASPTSDGRRFSQLRRGS